MSKCCFKFFFTTSHSQYYSCNWEWNQPNIYIFAKSNKLQSLFLAFEQVDGYSNLKRENHSILLYMLSTGANEKSEKGEKSLEKKKLNIAIWYDSETSEWTEKGE